MPPAKAIAQYSKGDKCFAFHRDLLYEAKVEAVEQEDPKDKKSPFKYKLHYKGWKKTWDEWVTEERLRKFTSENQEHAKQLMREARRKEEEELRGIAGDSKGGAKRKSAVNSDLVSHRDSEERSSSVQAPTRGTKRARDWELEKVSDKGSGMSSLLTLSEKSANVKQEEAFTGKPAIKIPMPDHLKGLLVDDWENITKSLLLVPLPHSYSVNKILMDYNTQESSKRRNGSPDADILEEVIQGVREYFDKALGRILLYRFERQQWLELHSRMEKASLQLTNGSNNNASDENDDPHTRDIGGKAPSDVYGAEHLCRLFVSMPGLIAQTNMDQQSVARLREELTKMTSWLGKNASKYFAKDYVNPGQEYVEKAKGD